MEDWLDDLEEDYEPDPSERIWYRNARDGQEGWFVRKGGRDYIRLNRPGVDAELALRPFTKMDWIPDRERRPFTMHQINQVAWAADRAYLHMTGDYKGSKVEWLSLTDRERIDWMENGPPGRDRYALWECIMEILRPLAK